MRIKLLLGVIVDGEHRSAGEELDVPVAMARLFIASNQAVPLGELPAAPPLTTSGQTIDHRDPRPRQT